MRTRCPSCGAALSLDTLVGHDAARDALAVTFKVTGPLGAVMVRYLALFRSVARDLTFDRVARLLGELQPDIEAQRITRGGQVYNAPPDAWIWALEQVVSARDSGRLTTPLKSHGYLYEVITNWRPSSGHLVTADARPTATSAPSKTMQAMMAAAGGKGNG